MHVHLRKGKRVKSLKFGHLCLLNRSGNGSRAGGDGGRGLSGVEQSKDSRRGGEARRALSWKYPASTGVKKSMRHVNEKREVEATCVPERKQCPWRMR